MKDSIELLSEKYGLSKETANYVWKESELIARHSSLNLNEIVEALDDSLKGSEEAIKSMGIHAAIAFLFENLKSTPMLDFSVKPVNVQYQLSD